MMRGRNNAEVTHQTDREVSVGKQLPFFPKKNSQKTSFEKKKFTRCREIFLPF